MPPTVPEMRDWILAAYPGGKEWKKKIEKKTDAQVLAMYKNLVKQGKIKGA